MNITLEQLRSAVRRCTPGAPDSYAERLWDAMEEAQAQDTQPDPAGYTAHGDNLYGPRS